ncbi:hypothetical protein, partial [Enterococcus italicus]|uniref:hypothetical protein n=1 Tax=Enterococcus italicus TaxID=246144 RepID=UPI003FA1A963
PNQGAFIAKTFKIHFNLFKIIVVKASASISSAIITKSFFQACKSCSIIAVSFVILLTSWLLYVLIVDLLTLANKGRKQDTLMTFFTKSDTITMI